MRDLPDLRTGIYRHWKGRYYEVTGYAHDANADSLYAGATVQAYLDGPGPRGHEAILAPMRERVVVMYVGLELDDAHKGPRHAVRDVDDFFKLVCAECGSDWFAGCLGNVPHAENRPVHRFEYVGPAWYGWQRNASTAYPAPTLGDEQAGVTLHDTGERQ